MYTNTNSWPFCQRAILENMIYQSYAVHKTNSDHILSLALTKGIVRYGSLYYTRQRSNVPVIHEKDPENHIFFIENSHYFYCACSHVIFCHFAHTPED